MYLALAMAQVLSEDKMKKDEVFIGCFDI